MPPVRQRLRPVKVPWQISPSASFLKLLAFESASDGPAQVSFVAHFGLFEQLPESESPSVSNSITTAASPHENTELEHWDGSAVYQLVRVSFERGLWIRMLPGYGDSDVLDPMAFDASALPLQDLSPANLEEMRRGFWQQWTASGFCPDPRMYEVEGSDWLEELHLGAKGYRHIVICGHDAFIEVIAKSWNWKPDGVLSERASQHNADT